MYGVYRVVGLERYSTIWEKVGIFLEQGAIGWLLNSPAFQLWYIVDLFKLVIVSPIIYWLVKKCKLFPVLLFGILWFLHISFLIDSEGLFFFTLGSYLAVNKVKIQGMEALQDTYTDKDRYKRCAYFLTIIWIGGCFGYSLLSATMKDVWYTPYVLLMLYKINVITGLLSVWKQYDLKQGDWQDKGWIKAVVSCTVFVYMAHEPLLHLLTDVLLEKNVFNGAHTLVYFALPMVIVAGCIGTGLLVKKICPKVYGMLVGGRGV